MAAKVLLVEDDQDTAQILQLYLAQEGYRLVVAFDQEEALKHSQELHPDLVILDLMTQGVKGPEICQCLRQQSWVPIIILASQLPEDRRLIVQNLNAAAYISKPFSPREVVNRVNIVLKGQECLIERRSGYLCHRDFPQTDAHQVLASTTSSKEVGICSRRFLQKLRDGRIDLRMAIKGWQLGRAGS